MERKSKIDGKRDGGRSNELENLVQGGKESGVEGVEWKSMRSGGSIV